MEFAGYNVKIQKLGDVHRVSMYPDRVQAPRFPKPDAMLDDDGPRVRSVSSVNHTASRVRDLVRTCGADRMFTLTTRKILPGRDLLAAFNVWRKLIVRETGYVFPFVAVLELQKRGAPHLHVAFNPGAKDWPVWFNVSGGLVRSYDYAYRLWLRCLRRYGTDGSFYLSPRKKHFSTRGLAGYIVKYITKGVGCPMDSRSFVSNIKTPPPVRLATSYQDVVPLIRDFFALNGPDCIEAHWISAKWTASFLVRDLELVQSSEWWVIDGTDPFNVHDSKIQLDW